MKSLLREFDEQAQKAIVVAESLSFDFGHQNVGSEHLLLSLLKIHDNQLKRLLQKYDVNDAVVEEDIKRLFGTNDDQPFYMEYSQSVKRILERSIEYAKDKNQDQVTLNILIISLLKEDDLLMITADHGNDPTFRGTDHTRENTPVIFYSKKLNNPSRLPILKTFSDIGATIADNFSVQAPNGESVLDKLI